MKHRFCHTNEHKDIATSDCNDLTSQPSRPSPNLGQPVQPRNFVQFLPASLAQVCKCTSAQLRSPTNHQWRPRSQRSDKVLPEIDSIFKLRSVSKACGQVVVQ